MLLYLAQRLALFVATLLFASLVVFAVMQILPGDAAETMLGPTATPEAVDVWPDTRLTRDAAWRKLLGEGLGWLAAIAGAIVATSLYGATDEWHQSFVPMRDSDVRDWVADTLGGTAGAVAYRVGIWKRRVRWRVERREPPAP